MNIFNINTDPNLREEILNRFISLLMNDLERASFLGLPSDSRIRDGAKIISKDKLIIGKNVWIGENAILDASGGLEIGDNSQIGLGVFIWSHDSYRSAIMGLNTRITKKGIVRKRTIIGKNCFIGGPSVIMPGVTIGDKCIISPMSVVYNDLPSKTVYQPYKDLMDIKYNLLRKDKEIELLKEEINILKKQIG